MTKKYPGLNSEYLNMSAKAFLSVSLYHSQARKRKENVFHGWKVWNESVPESMKQSQVQDQLGGMNDGKIRNKLKRIDQTGKAAKKQMEEASPEKPSVWWILTFQFFFH